MPALARTKRRRRSLTIWRASFSTKASKGSELRPPPADGASDGRTPSVEEVDAFLAAVGVS